jgi:hypothetical protein
MWFDFAHQPGDEGDEGDEGDNFSASPRPHVPIPHSPFPKDIKKHFAKPASLKIASETERWRLVQPLQ